MSMEHYSNDTDRRKPKHSEKNLFNYHYVHHKSHMHWPGKEIGPPRWQACDQPSVCCHHESVPADTSTTS